MHIGRGYVAGHLGEHPRLHAEAIHLGDHVGDRLAALVGAVAAFETGHDRRVGVTSPGRYGRLIQASKTGGSAAVVIEDTPLRLFSVRGTAVDVCPSSRRAPRRRPRWPSHREVR